MQRIRETKCFFFTLAFLLFFSYTMGNSSIKAAATGVLVFKSQEAEPYNEALEGFRAGLQEKDASAHLKVISLEGNSSKALETLKETKEERPALVLALGSLAAKIASETISDVPIISGMILRSDDLMTGANTTGVFLDYSIETHFSWLRRFLPDAMTIGVIYNPDENQSKIVEAKTLAEKTGVKLLAHTVTTPREIPKALEYLSSRIDVLWGIPDKMVFTQQTAKQILLFSFKNRIPLIGLSSSWVKAGALYALDWDYREVGRECGERAAAILQGPGRSVPPGVVKSVRYSLNLKAAERMKISFPEEVIKKAKTVY